MKIFARDEVEEVCAFCNSISDNLEHLALHAVVQLGLLFALRQDSLMESQTVMCVQSVFVSNKLTK